MCHWLEKVRHDAPALGRFLEPDPAEVLSVKPCPEIQPGPGRVVTGMFRSASATVLQIRVEGLAEPIGATGAHPFWSEDRLAYVPAGELRPGERLRTLEGATPAVVSITPMPGVHRVYNLEVEAEHTFRVSPLKLLCHNACPDQAALRDLVNEATNGGRKPLSTADAETVLDWADEINYPGVRAKPGDVSSPSNWTLSDGSQPPHIHIPGAGRGAHVPVDPGVNPR